MARIYTREEIYDLVWTTPISQVAGRFGLSDRGFAKICQKHEIPVPGRGHWARIEAGQIIDKSPLPKVSDQYLEQLDLRRVLDPHSQFLNEATKAAKQSLLDEQAVLEGKRLKNARTLSSESQSSLDNLAKRLRSAEPHHLHDWVRVGWIEIDPKSISRVLAFLTSLARQLQPFGIVFFSEGDDTEFVQDGSSIHFAVRTPRTRVPAPPKSWERYVYVFTGKLTLQVYGWATDGGKRNWSFAPDEDLSAKVEEIAECFRLNLAVKRAHDQREQRQKAHLQHLADRRALAKKRREREVEREAFVAEVANAQRKIDELRSAISTLEASQDPSPEYARMVSWAKSRMVELERSARMEALTANLIEMKLFPEPDELYDPEGEPPSGSGA